MNISLPESAVEFMSWSWAQIEPFYTELSGRPLDASNVDAWLLDWSRLESYVEEAFQRHYVAVTVDTTDEQAQASYDRFVDDIRPNAKAASQVLKQRLLDSALEPAGFELPLRNMRAEAELFREENLQLLSEELKLSNEYDRIIGAQTLMWEGEERTIAQLKPVFLNVDRVLRERAWRLTAQRQLDDRQAINDLWVRFMDVRKQIADNAGMDNYRTYRWKDLLRFDYTPDDAKQYHDAIEEVVVPVAEQIYEDRRQRLGVSRLRPWDLNVDLLGRPPLQPFSDLEELVRKVSNIFHRVDPQLGAYFDIMRQEGLLDLENRKGKAPGGYCTGFDSIRRPFIFTNAVGLHEDVQTMLHEGGHAFHVFETAPLPYIQQIFSGMEFAEVASMAMELLSAPYLTKDQGGFYSRSEAARARIEHLEESVLFWPYMAVVDAFQHWAYENHAAATDPAKCDEKWAELWQRYMIGIDWSDLEDEMTTGWQRKLHIHQVPFYYIEYGLAQMGAIQVWQHALSNQAAAVAAYRKALSLGGTVPIPDLYATAGARFAFDASTLKSVVDLAMETINELKEVQD